MLPKLPSLDCCGCSACVNVCPHDALSMVENAEGFLTPHVDGECCVGCFACEMACPVLYQVHRGHKKIPLTYAAWINDEKVRKLSSSGGIFSALAISVIQRDGIVFGAVFDENLELHYGSAETEAELAALRGSKYLQASVGFAYRSVNSALENGRNVLFVGTPCQVAGLYGFLGNGEYSRLLTADVVCHGVPSPKVFRKYIREKASLEHGRIRQIRFRDKVSGWKNYSVVTLKGEEKGQNSDSDHECLEMLTPFSEDLFMRAFLSNICLRSSCYACRYNRLPRVADITLGDYWGVEKVHPELDDDRGVSLVLVNSERGAEAWGAIQKNIVAKSSDLKKAIVFNPSICQSSRSHRNRGRFFAELDSKPLSQIVKKFCKIQGWTLNNLILAIKWKFFI